MNALACLLAALLLSVDHGETKAHDIFQTVPELIQDKGYPVEVHHVETADGYVLELHRIPQTAGRRRPGSAVLLMHGLQDSSAAWVINPRRSLGFMLADQGYDVWLGNNRGNRYSRKHVRLSPDSRQFWQFTADDYARYDNPAIIDYILHVTGYEDLFYIGFSSSTWSFWAMMNHDPSYNSKVRLMVALGPVATMKYWRSIARLAVPFSGALVHTADKLGIYESLPYNTLYGNLGKVFCSKHSPTVLLCALGIFLLAGWDPKQLDKASLPQIFAHVPAGVGTRVEQQFAQHISSGRFQRFDYGKKRNLAIYGQRKPPLYFPELVTVPVVLMWGKNDKMADKRDVAALAARLPNLVSSRPVAWPLWQHLDFLWGIDAHRLVYQRILQRLHQFSSRAPREYIGRSSVVYSGDGNDISATYPSDDAANPCF
ncbi:lipase 3-like [Pollicipes pollicipes]|uniref:lipase 3-like n=1 Tax=Pollicipes pollicipes TaxID=41117 RepID=UPI001884C1A2|nr:lipase 3-like [Pollicipes pollicipes]